MTNLKRLLITGVLAALLGTPLPTPSAGAAPDFSLPTTAAPRPSNASSTCWKWRPAEKKFARAHNLARDAAGVGRLRLDRHLGRVARKHTSEMIKKNKLYHTPSGTFGWRVTRWSILGENVGVGGSVDSLVTAFMNSPSHRANILYSKFGYIGVGTRWRDGRLWVTVVFEAKRNPGTRLSMPPC